MKNVLLIPRCILFGSLLVALSAAPARARQVRVFILAGQSNMQGQGFIAADPKRNSGKGSLEYVAKDPATADRFKQLLDDKGKWAVRDDVWISYLDRKGPLTVGYGVNPERIGPELGFGWVMGEQFKEPVLLIKCAWGGKSLAVDFRPPSSGKIPYPLNAKTAATIEKDPQIVGFYYRETVKLSRETIDRMGELFPSLAGCEPVLSGFGWHQGWNDRIDNQFNAEYEKNLANFIRDIRSDLKAPGLPFVVAGTGMNGPNEKNPRALSLMKAQAAVADYPEFKGNVAFVETRPFWREVQDSPSNQGYHWNTNAETYYLIGEAMGKSMNQLMSHH
jgi:alpha-galactosidase